MSAADRGIERCLVLGLDQVEPAPETRTLVTIAIPLFAGIRGVGIKGSDNTEQEALSV